MKIKNYQLAKDITKGLIGDYVIRVAQINEVFDIDLAQILREIADQIHKQ